MITINKSPLIQQTILGGILVVAAATAFSSKSILIKLAYDQSQSLDAITLMVLRMSFALPFYLIIGLFHHHKTKPAVLNQHDWMMMLGLGFLGYYFASYLDLSGLKYISAGLERLTLFLYPTLVVLLSALFYRQPITQRQRIALGLSYVGILCVFGGHVQDTPHLLKGISLVFASAVSFALFMMLNGQVIQRIGSIRLTTYSMTIACGLTLIHFLLTHPLAALKTSQDIYLLAFSMATIATVIPSFLMNAGIHRIGASSAAIISSAGPIITLLLAYVILKEQLTLLQIQGTLLVLAGALIMGLKSKN